MPTTMQFDQKPVIEHRGIKMLKSTSHLGWYTWEMNGQLGFPERHASDELAIKDFCERRNIQAPAKDVVNNVKPVEPITLTGRLIGKPLQTFTYQFWGNAVAAYQRFIKAGYCELKLVDSLGQVVRSHSS